MKARIKIRPMSHEKARNEGMGIPITQSGSTFQGLESIDIFGELHSKPDRATKAKDVKAYNRGGYIRLPASYANEFLCDNAYGVLNKIMPKPYIHSMYGKEVCVADIVNKPLIYDIVGEEFVEMAGGNSSNNFNMEVFNKKRHLVGGDVIKYFLSQVNFKKELEIEVFEFARKTLNMASNTMGYSRSNKEFQRDMLKLVTHKTHFHVIDDYYMEVTPHESRSGIVESEEFQEVYSKITEGRFADEISNSRMSYLLPLVRSDEHVEDLFNLLQDFIMVLPVGYRPTTEDGVHPLTRQYEKILRAASSLEAVMNNNSSSYQQVANNYNEMLKCIKVLTTNKDAGGKKDVKTGYKTLKETLTGKEGLVRNKLQSSIFDYAARSVIISDPNMSIRKIGVPYKILRNIFEIYYLQQRKFDNRSARERMRAYEDIKKDSNSEAMKEFIDEMVKDVPIAIGRQPTLYALGIQGFEIQPVEGNSIVLSPLVTPAFNADFDGDQAYLSLPISEAAQTEVKTVMKNTNNVYLPKDGECHIAPRHEIIYGLWLASKAEPTGKVVFDQSGVTINISFLNKVIEAVINDTYDITDIVRVGGHEWSLGQFAVKACAGVSCCSYAIGDMNLARDGKLGKGRESDQEGKEKYKSDAECTAKWCAKLLTHVRDTSMTDDLFVNIADNYTKVGFAVAGLYPPNISVVDTPDLSDLVDGFEDSISKSQALYEVGIETSADYNRVFTESYDRLMKSAKTRVDNYLGPENGFIKMRDSKCRGDASTVMQILGLKGRMQRGSGRAFNAIVEHGMAHGLTGLEHFVTAYGGRQGQIDKSIETATPGYISRTMSHAANEIVITERDCGTHEGLLLTFDRLARFLNYDADDALYGEVEKYFVSIVTGRYLVEAINKDGLPDLIDETKAEEVFTGMVARYDDTTKTITRLQGIHLRSPITCANPCCQMCYGVWLRKHKAPDIKFDCGMEAGQSIGEPGTQLTMKTFQQGGVVSDANLTSSFDTMQKYLNLTNLDTYGPKITDVMASEDCEIKEVLISNNLKNVYLVSNGKMLNNKPYVYYRGVKFKEVVKKGETIMRTPGDLNMRNIIEVASVDEAIFYLTMKLYNIFWNESFVDIKHFETLVSSLVLYTCNRSFGEYKSGLNYTRIQYLADGGDLKPENFYKTLVGVNAITHKGTSPLRGVMFERMQANIAQHIIKSNEDTLTSPYVRYSLGLFD